ncbi:mobilization protein [Bacteroidia bacterium]|nr:mobilization protein [Bacteroidia bacterium]
MYMGFVVLHLNKASGNDAGTSAHIERTIHPKNADEKRTHLNRELMEFPEGVANRTGAIQHRIDTAGITRKVGKNQVRAIRVMLSGTSEDMKRIEESGRLEDWCADNLDWLKKTFGADNLVSAVLHMDEKTPHIHATVVPVVSGERRKAQASRQEDGKNKYRKKNPGAARLCADDVMARDRLKGYQDSYAQRMQAYGLQRGIAGSEARHVNTQEYYRELYVKNEGLEDNIDCLLKLEDAKMQAIDELNRQEQESRQQYEAAKALREEKESELDETQEALRQVRGQLKTEKLKSTAADVGSSLIGGIGSIIGTSKVRVQQQEIESLKAENQELRQEVKDLNRSIQIQQQEHETAMDKLKQELKKIHDLFPHIKELLRMENLCRLLGFSEGLTKILLEMKPVAFNGILYSPEHKQKFETEHSVAEIKQHPTEQGRLRLTIDGMSDTNWFRQKYQEFQKAIGINVKPKHKTELQNKHNGMTM